MMIRQYRAALKGAGSGCRNICGQKQMVEKKSNGALGAIEKRIDPFVLALDVDSHRNGCLVNEGSGMPGLRKGLEHRGPIWANAVSISCDVMERDGLKICCYGLP